MPEYDKLTYQLLANLYESAMTEQQVQEFLDSTPDFPPDSRISALIKDGMIRVITEGEPDGEGGLIEETVQRTFTLLPRGRAVVERVRRKHLKWMIGTGIALASAIAAIAAALPR